VSSPQTAIPFGNYVLIKRLAVGGMAELFLAQRPPEPELVVLKRILPYLSEEPEFVQMFLDEARIAAQLHHPNIVQVHELGNWEDSIFIAMEYVAGVDLRRVVAEEAKYGATVPYGVAARICASVAAGLDYAHHSRGVDGRPLELIHRDVSPQNVMIGYDGRVKLVDFGIAKAGAFMERSKPGVIKGKFLYLAPEQVAQERLDHRADIFALGTMLYEVTTGKQPFAKPTTEGILYAIRYEDPSPPHLLRADYPEALSRIVMRCLTKDRNQRYQRAAAVRADLEGFLESGVLRQSLDVAGYIARLMGEEEERTVLHIPVARGAGRKDATVPLSATWPSRETEPPRPAPLLDSTAPTLPVTSPHGESQAAQLTPSLTARPTPRRGSGDTLPVTDYTDEPEPSTQMARPRELPTGGRGDDEDEEVATAINTAPESHTLAAEVAAELSVEDEEAEYTRPIRSRGREERPRVPSAPPVAPSPVRRSGPHADPPVAPRPSALLEPQRSRRVSPAASTPAAAPPRRTPRPDEEASQSVSVTPPLTPPRRASALDTSADATTDMGEEPSQSVSITPPTLNQRVATRSVPPASRRAAADAEDDASTLHSGRSRVEHTDPTPTLRPDPDDEEPTTGYEGYSGGDTLDASTLATPPRRRLPVTLMVAGGGALLLALAVGVVWALRPQPLPPAPASTTEGPGATGTADTPGATGQKAGTPRPGPEPEQVTGVTPPGPTGEEPPVAPPAEDAGTGLAAPVREADAGSPMAEPVADAGTPAPALIQVRFEAPSRTVLRQEGGERLAVNKVLSLPPGKLRVRFDCPGRRGRKGTKTYVIEPDGEEPRVLQVPCKSRR
jgi:serine/threonine protein kinase